jgi:hypothetical protein
MFKQMTASFHLPLAIASLLSRKGKLSMMFQGPKFIQVIVIIEIKKKLH